MIYVGDEIELDGLEAGASKDNTKEFGDSKKKLPIVLRSMLLSIVTDRSTLIHKAHVVGYNINGRYP